MLLGLLKSRAEHVRTYCPLQILFEGRKKKSAEFPGESSDSPSSSSEPVPASGEEPVPANAEESDGAEPAEEQGDAC